MTKVSDSGYPFAIGEEHEAIAQIGRTARPLRGDVRVNAAQIQTQAAVLEDGNASYWDEAFADVHWGGLIAPPGMVQLWALPLPWTPSTGPKAFHGAATDAPLPGDVPLNVATDCEYFEPVRVGDRLTQTDTLVEVRRAENTPFGAGHLLVFRSDYHNQHGVLVARLTDTLLRYGGEARAAATMHEPAAAAVDA